MFPASRKWSRPPIQENETDISCFNSAVEIRDTTKSLVVRLIFTGLTISIGI